MQDNLTWQSNKDPNYNHEIWLLGQPLLNDYLHYLDDALIDNAHPGRSNVIAEWSKANDYYDTLAETEANIADHIDCQPLSSDLLPLAALVAADSRFQKTFDSVPTRFAWVELEKLVVFQLHVTASFIDNIKTRLLPRPDNAALFHFCLPLTSPACPVEVSRMGKKRFVFTSPSSDFQFQEATLLKPDQLIDYQNYGAISAVLGLSVGYGSNFLNALEDSDSGRLILHNGYHRACALLASGITHAPCIIQTVSRRDELDVCAPAEVSRSPGYYFNKPRPPMLKDFFDPNIRKIWPIKKMVRKVELNFEMKEYWLPA